jgi:pyruvate dehydrogenase E1 component alpha subunit
MSLQNVAQKSCAYEVASEFVDGMDVIEMRRAVQRAVTRARDESLPTLIEARTYRYMGHSMSDPGNYRTRAEIEKYQERDPIKTFVEKLKKAGVLTDADVQHLETQVKEEVDRSIKFADESPEPDPNELYTDVYANPID